MNIKTVLRNCKEYAAKYPNSYDSWQADWKSLPSCHGYRTMEGSSVWFFEHKKEKLMGVSSDRIMFHYCDKILDRVRHTGWYADAFQENVYRGVVARFGKTYLSGYEDRQCNTIIFELDRFEDEESAARRSNDFAESAAEDAREEDIKYQAEAKVDSLKEEIIHEASVMRELFAGIRKSTLDPVICQAMRECVKSHVESIRQMRRDIVKYTECPWEACPQ